MISREVQGRKQALGQVGFREDGEAGQAREGPIDMGWHISMHP